jgi:hypothetical protein
MEVHLCVPYGSHNKERLFPLNSVNQLDCLAETYVPVRYGLYSHILYGSICVCSVRFSH